MTAATHDGAPGAAWPVARLAVVEARGAARSWWLLASVLATAGWSVVLWRSYVVETPVLFVADDLFAGAGLPAGIAAGLWSATRSADDRADRWLAGSVRGPAERALARVAAAAPFALVALGAFAAMAFAARAHGGIGTPRAPVVAVATLVAFAFAGAGSLLGSALPPRAAVLGVLALGVAVAAVGRAGPAAQAFAPWWGRSLTSLDALAADAATAHLAYVAALVALLASAAVATAARTRASYVAVAVAVVAACAGAATVRAAHASPLDAASATALVTGDAATECATEGPVTACVVPGFEPWRGDLLATARRVVEVVPPREAFWIRQSAWLLPPPRRGIAGGAAVALPDDRVYAGLSRDPATGSDPALAGAVAARVLGLRTAPTGTWSPRAVLDGRCLAEGQVAAAAAWLLAATDRVARDALRSAAEAGETFGVGLVQVAPEWARLADALADRPFEHVRELVRAHRDDLSRVDLAAAAGVRARHYARPPATRRDIGLPACA